MLQFHLVKFPSKFSANLNQISRKPAIQRFSFRCGWMNRWIHIHSILTGILIVIKDSRALNKQSYIARKTFPGVKTLLPILQEQYRPHHDFSCADPLFAGILFFSILQPIKVLFTLNWTEWRWFHGTLKIKRATEIQWRKAVLAMTGQKKR